MGGFSCLSRICGSSCPRGEGVDVQELVARFLEERARELVSGVRGSFMEPRLYRELYEDSIRRFSSLHESFSKKFGELRAHARGSLDIRPIDLSGYSPSFSSVVSSDASSYPFPIAATHLALIGGVAVNVPRISKVSLNGKVLDAGPEISETEFRFLYSAIREAMIPKCVIHQLENFDKPDLVLIDGPFSLSQWWREAWSQEIRSRVQELIDAKNILLHRCRELGVIPIAVVKRTRARYLHHAFGLEEESNYSDQFLLNNLMKYGEMTQPFSVTEAIRKWRSKEGGGRRGLLIDKLHYEIMGFYIKTSRNPLTPPIRVEYPKFVENHADEIAKFVLSTSVQSYDKDYDGLPATQCIAHKLTKISKEIMLSILESGMSKVMEDGGDPRLFTLFGRISLH